MCLRPPSRSSPRGGFSLLELLVVIAIIVILLSLFLSGIMRAWEAYNVMRCQNNLNNINKAMTMYTGERGDTGGLYPTGGGDPTNARTLIPSGEPGSGVNQDWGWPYQIMKQMEGDTIWATSNDAQVRAHLKKEYFCPTRRGPTSRGDLGMIDYAGNAGCWSFVNPATGDNFTADTMIPDGIAPMTVLGTINVNVNLPSPNAPLYPVKCGIFVKGRAGVGPGAVAVNIPVRVMDLTDGNSYTILISEKRMNSHMYTSSPVPVIGDRYGYCSGFSNDTLRTSDQRYPPTRDERDNSNLQIVDGFGSAHPTVFNALFADGSVRKIRYNMSLDGKLCNVRPPVPPAGPWAGGPPPSGTNFGGPIHLTLFQRLCHRSDAQNVPHTDFEN